MLKILSPGLVYVVFLFTFLHCQAQTPTLTGGIGIQLPSLPVPQPSSMPNYANFGNNTKPNTNGQVNTGATAEDILRQVNRGNPYYNAGGNLEDIQKANNAWIQAKMMTDPAYNPTLRNGTINNFAMERQRELLGLLQDIINLDNYRNSEQGTANEDFNSPLFAAKTKAYTDALQSLNDMLSGKRPLSIADAYFEMENAFGKPYLSYDEYNDIIKQSAGFIRQWMKSNKQDLRNNAAINYAVQQFMGQKLTISLPKSKGDKPQSMETTIHLPFGYDYSDFKGEKDHRNYFLTKCLATGMGQCNSLPAVYLVLVEALGGTANLAIAPQHSFIKYTDKNGSVRNYEPTSNWDISDQWYLENMFISRKAINTGIYLTAYTKKQLIADIGLQLSFGYFRKFGAADEKFIRETIRIAENQFPKGNNIATYFTYSNMYGYELAQVMRKYRIARLQDIGRYPEAKVLYDKWLQNEQALNQLGFQQVPKPMYEEMMKEAEFKGRVQNQYGAAGKVKRSLFIQTK